MGTKYQAALIKNLEDNVDKRSDGFLVKPASYYKMTAANKKRKERLLRIFAATFTGKLKRIPYNLLD